MTGTLVPRYTFETFPLGQHYRFARAAAVAVAEAPGTACNPLFIYGALRLGRTHLLHAIGNCAQELHPGDHRVMRRQPSRIVHGAHMAIGAGVAHWFPRPAGSAASGLSGPGGGVRLGGPEAVRVILRLTGKAL